MTASNRVLDTATLRSMHPADLAKVFEECDPSLHGELLSRLDDEKRADLLIHLDPMDRQQLLEQTSVREIAELIGELESDDAADVLGDLEEDTVVRVLEVREASEPEEAEELRELLKYPKDSAGGLMQVEVASIRQSASSTEAIQALRSWQDDVENMHFIFVVDDEDRFIGTVRMARLALAEPHTPIADLMEIKFVEVRPTIDQEEVARVFAKYDIISLAVTDEESRLLGRILVDDVVEVMEEEADEDAYRMVGSDAEELLYGDRPFKISLIRLPWLVVNLVGGFCTGLLLWIFQATLEETIALVAFVPVITAMGGNVGSQSAMIVIRGYATGRIDPSAVSTTVVREGSIGLFMGLLCGGMIGLVSVAWLGDPTLGIVVGSAMFAAMSVATAIGALAPVAFRRLGVDPAIAAGPFVTTANDITGILIYMLTATALLS
ncbi:MAG TPA: magnesium transporter [Myxococcales bacterium]|nr:magnesium transporter [Myxococcales bacterium]